MQWDLGLYGLGVLAAMSLAFGLASGAVSWRGATRWMWLIAAVAFFVSGLLLSEGIFGWATVEELQPNIDGLSFDETLLSIFPGLVVVGITWRLTRRTHATVE